MRYIANENISFSTPSGKIIRYNKGNSIDEKYFKHEGQKQALIEDGRVILEEEGEKKIKQASNKKLVSKENKKLEGEEIENEQAN